MLQETRETGDTGTQLTVSTVVRYYLTEIKPKMGEISNILKFQKVLKKFKKGFEKIGKMKL